MRGWIMGLAGLAAGLALPAAAQQTTTLYSYRHWEVEHVRFEDGSVACLAEVDAVSDSFTVWYYPDGVFRLQFYSTAWSFGEDGQRGDLQVRIDRRSPWSLTNAELYKNSVLFSLPDNDTGVRFLMEVARGNTLFLNTATGQGVKSYSLAGSRASMQALVDCGEGLHRNPGNPFN